MYGVVTRNAEEADWPEFERTFYEVKDPSGRHADPVDGTTSLVACFADTATAETTPELAAVDGSGARATRERTPLDAGYVCPSEPRYREGVLETVAEAAAVSGDVRLDAAGFPDAGYCRCERCASAFADSRYDDWTAWRAAGVTSFVAAAADRVAGTTHLALEPDPGRLRERWGFDAAALAAHVDEFVVPLYDTNYDTTYWATTIAAAFADRLDAPLGVELYAAGVDVDALVRAVEAVAPHADHVYFGYESGTARAALRRMAADEREGESYGP